MTLVRFEPKTNDERAEAIAWLRNLVPLLGTGDGRFVGMYAENSTSQTARHATTGCSG